MDTFKTWLQNKNKISLIERALTDTSYNNYRSKGVKKSNPNFEEFHKPLPVNTDLATYGDAIIKMIYCEKYLDISKQLSKKIENYTTDSFFVNNVARYYKVLDYLKYDKDDIKKKKDYNYEGESKDNPRKYIATAIEAMIAAIYIITKENSQFNVVKEILEEWTNL